MRTGSNFAWDLAAFAPTSLAEMEGSALLNRVDTKYLLSASSLGAILPSLATEYRALDVDGRRMHRYRTLYFDTSDFAFYRRHHAGRTVRHKVRRRTYVDTGRSFFEIKAKDAEGRTLKHRVETSGTPAPLAALTPESRALLAAHLPADEWSVGPKLWSAFVRVTLVGVRSPERLTLDLGIQFDHEGRTAILPGVAVAEVKQSGSGQDSAFAQRMREEGIRPRPMSKYCVGVAMLAPGVEHDAFGEQIRVIETIASGDLAAC